MNELLDYVVGLDNGGTTNKITVLDRDGNYLIDELLELPSRVAEGPEAAIGALREAFEYALEAAGIGRHEVLGVGFDTPGPASANGVLSAQVGTKFSHPAWRSYDYRGALEAELELPVVYSNDANAAGLYAHHRQFGDIAGHRSSVAAIIGTGFGGSVVHRGLSITGAVGMAGELGHMHIPMDGLLRSDQPTPVCICGFVGDGESIASLSALRRSLLPYWLRQYPDHPLRALPIDVAARELGAYGDSGDEMARAIFEQQAMAVGRVFTIASNFIDAHAYLVGGSLVEVGESFRQWFLERVRTHTTLRPEQREIAEIGLVNDLDKAGCRGAAVNALAALAY